MTTLSVRATAEPLRSARARLTCRLPRRFALAEVRVSCRSAGRLCWAHASGDGEQPGQPEASASAPSSMPGVPTSDLAGARRCPAPSRRRWLERDEGRVGVRRAAGVDADGQLTSLGGVLGTVEGHDQLLGQGVGLGEKTCPSALRVGGDDLSAGARRRGLDMVSAFVGVLPSETTSTTTPASLASVARRRGSVELLVSPPSDSTSSDASALGAERVQRLQRRRRRRAVPLA